MLGRSHDPQGAPAREAVMVESSMQAFPHSLSFSVVSLHRREKSCSYMKAVKVSPSTDAEYISCVAATLYKRCFWRADQAPQPLPCGAGALLLEGKRMRNEDTSCLQTEIGDRLIAG